MEKKKFWKLGLELPLLCSSRKSNNGIIDGNVEDMYQIYSMI